MAYTFTLNLIIDPEKADAPALPGFHQVSLVPGPVRSGYPSQPGMSANKDGDGPYLESATGAWAETTPYAHAPGSPPPPGSAPTTASVIAHEVGHLLGLRDDYTDGPNGVGVPRPGVNPDELMANSWHGKVTQPLVTRIAYQIQDAGYKIPKLCHATYNISVKAVVQWNYTVSGLKPPDFDGNENIAESWTSTFNNSQVMIVRYHSIGSIIELHALAGTTQGQVVFSETRNQYGGPCSGTITTPLYSAAGTWGDLYMSGGLSFDAGLNLPDQIAFAGLVSAQDKTDCPARDSLEYKYGCCKDFTGPGQALPCTADFQADGTAWTVEAEAMQAEFEHPKGSYAPSQAVAQGKSAVVNSGAYFAKDLYVCMGDVKNSPYLSRGLTNEKFAVTFTRVH